MKPAPIYAPPTLDQLLANEKAAAKQLTAAASQKQPQLSEGAEQQQHELKAEGEEQPQEEQRDEEKHKQQQQLQQWQEQQLSVVPTLQEVLSGPVRVVYGYSLAGRGLLQLIRGLPPYPDWVSCRGLPWAQAGRLLDV